MAAKNVGENTFSTGSLVHAVHEVADRPGVHTYLRQGEWRIEFTEAGLITWLAEQRAMARREALAENAPEPRSPQPDETPQTWAKGTQEAAHRSRAAIDKVLRDWQSQGRSSFQVSELNVHRLRDNWGRSRSWLYRELDRLRAEGRVRHEKEGQWALIPSP
ncbi:hypothetical protein ACFW3Z_25680 [Nocardiopsis alba]|uniref:hypothetical protein n=1 Tax=Nocardiopsis alba TaxID=53437 RepID=UPI00366BF1CF